MLSAKRSSSPISVVSSVVSTEERARIYMKRFAYSRNGALAYLAFVGAMMVLSIFLIMYSLINTTDRRFHQHVYTPVWWVQTLEALVDASFLLEIACRAFLRTSISTLFHIACSKMPRFCSPRSDLYYPTYACSPRSLSR